MIIVDRASLQLSYPRLSMSADLNIENALSQLGVDLETRDEIMVQVVLWPSFGDTALHTIRQLFRGWILQNIEQRN